MSSMNRNDITLAVDVDGNMYIAQGNPALEALDNAVGTDYDCEINLYYSQVSHRCAALTPDGWRVLYPFKAQREGYRWTRFANWPLQDSRCVGTPCHQERAL